MDKDCLAKTSATHRLRAMKPATRRSVQPRAKGRNGRRVSAQRLPSFADAVKRVAGMIEGAPDLSSREGFGPKLLG